MFELPDGSYVQCRGRKTALTVEARECRPDGSFTHWVFGRGDLTGQPGWVGPRENRVQLDTSQVLTLRDARLIIRQFLETRTFPTQF